MKIARWKCLPCRERARLVEATSKERIVKGTSTYRLLRGRKNINDKWYVAGDLVELTEEQAMNLRLSIEPAPAHDAAVHETAKFKTTLADRDDLDDDAYDEDTDEDWDSDPVDEDRDSDPLDKD